MAAASAVVRRLGFAAWAMIYSGLLLAAVGLALKRHEVEWSWILIAAGALDAVAGVVLVWVRSRLPDDGSI